MSAVLQAPRQYVAADASAQSSAYLAVPRVNAELAEAAEYALDVLNRDRGKQARLRAIQRLQLALDKAKGAAA